MSFGECSAAFDMPQLLQSAKFVGKSRLCTLRHDFPATLLQTARMDDVEILLDRTANNLRHWREHRKLSQMELGRLVGTTGAVISLLESGDRQLSTKWLHRLAPALGIRPGFLVDYDPHKLDTSTLELIEAASAIATEELPIAIKMLKGLAKSA